MSSINEYSMLIRQEAEHWDRINERRSASDYIPYEADIRRATRAPLGGQDPEISLITTGDYRESFLNWVAHVPNGRVLDVCCGPGWLALELGRRGQRVDAFDLSPEAIGLAKRMLRENPYQDGFGRVDYHLQDVTTFDLGCERYDAVSGWSAFHHLQNLPEFMARVWRSLKPGGVVATMDDSPQGRLERTFEYLLHGLLPSYSRTYREKALRVMRRLSRRKTSAAGPPPINDLSPMEAISTEHIGRVFYAGFEVLEDNHFNAFAASIAPALGGGDGFRYPTARLITRLDRLLCRVGVFKGVYRVIIARKPL